MRIMALVALSLVGCQSEPREQFEEKGSTAEWNLVEEPSNVSEEEE